MVVRACSQTLCNSEGNDHRTLACKMTARESLATFRARVARRPEVHGSCRAGAWAARGETGLGPRSGPLGILLCRLTPLGRRDERRGKLRRSHRLLAVVGVFNSPSRGMQDRKKPEIDNRQKLEELKREIKPLIMELLYSGVEKSDIINMIEEFFEEIKER